MNDGTRARVLALSMVGCLTASPAMATILTFDIVDPTDYAVSENFPEGVGVGDSPNPLDGYGSFVTSGSGLHANGTTTFGYGEAGEGFTPNVRVDYGPFSIFTGGPELWRKDYGDLERVLYQGSRGSVGNNYDYLDIVFTADAGFEVELYGFDLAGWFMSDYVIRGVSVYDGIPFPFLTPTNQLDAQANVDVQGAGGTHTTVTYATPLRAQQIWLSIDATNLGDLSENIGIDNIRFGQRENAANNRPLPAPNLEDLPDRVSVPAPGGLLLGLGALALALGARRRVACA